MKTNKVKMNESQLREFVSKVIRESLSEIRNPFDDGFGGVDVAMARNYPNSSISDPWLEKSGLRRDRLQEGKVVPIQGQGQQGQMANNESLNETLEQADPEQIYRTLLAVADKMRDYAWEASNSRNITTAIVNLGNAIKAWVQAMKDNGIRTYHYFYYR